MIAPGTEPGLWQTARALARRDLRLLWRRRGDALQPLMFAVLVVVLFALALGREPQLMAQVGAAVLWLAVLLAGQLALDSMFRSDAEDGSLEQWLLAPVPLAWLVLVRVLLHWATTALPLIVVSPLLAEMLHLPHDQLPILLASLLLGTPLLSLIGGVVAALTVGIRRSGILVACWPCRCTYRCWCSVQAVSGPPHAVRIRWGRCCCWAPGWWWRWCLHRWPPPRPSGYR